ncbi:MAG: hypothetical protein MJE68_07825 [Proteobacteria bacterium]|nr:hypothetical protein [Pseudomonadota bacterium]
MIAQASSIRAIHDRLVENVLPCLAGKFPCRKSLLNERLGFVLHNEYGDDEDKLCQVLDKKVLLTHLKDNNKKWCVDVLSDELAWKMSCMIRPTGIRWLCRLLELDSKHMDALRFSNDMYHCNFNIIIYYRDKVVGDSAVALEMLRSRLVDYPDKVLSMKLLRLLMHGVEIM